MRRFVCPALLALACACGPDAPDPARPGDASPGPHIAFEAEGTLDIVREGAPVRSLAIEIADTDSARERGLMERAPLRDDQGMLFVFDYAAPQTFWMASTPASLDIVFIGADSAVVNVAKYTRPFSLDGVSSEVMTRRASGIASG